MSAADLVLVCALELLGRSPEALPPIVILDTAPAYASPHAAGFVRRGEHVIYLIASAPVFRSALEAKSERGQCRGLDSLRLIASIIVHEEWHLNHDSTEEGAYYAQLTALLQLGSGPGRWPYESVRKALHSVRTAEARRMQIASSQIAASR